MKKQEGVTDQPVLDLFKESLCRTGEAMLALAQRLDAGSMRPLDEEEKMLLRTAVLGMFRQDMREVPFWIVSGNIDDACDLMRDWVKRLGMLS